jgi:outer membrane receptor protein involved in Fe transport
MSAAAAIGSTLCGESSGVTSHLVAFLVLRERNPVSVNRFAGVKPASGFLFAFAALSAIFRAGNGSAASVQIRGIGSTTTSIGIEQSVAVMIDGVYFPQGRAINEGLFDVGQVAVLKGPQALYFGKNATAGVVAVTSNNPTDEPTAPGPTVISTTPRMPPPSSNGPVSTRGRRTTGHRKRPGTRA